ncbi:hypothetical protein RC62_1536 [Flavobacterium aquidurense]|uniref:Uncharacterized protein n=1 Tax=Flavobacterium aquidurense TaxID=362413 RepID=A0A0Q0S863_9FLAO|nr:hypothetical protein RC62_1536 [Flavobacterium aquidurense]
MIASVILAIAGASLTGLLSGNHLPLVKYSGRCSFYMKIHIKVFNTKLSAVP